jgi:hypothetical protein
MTMPISMPETSNISAVKPPTATGDGSVRPSAPWSSASQEKRSRRSRNKNAQRQVSNYPTNARALFSSTSYALSALPRGPTSTRQFSLGRLPHAMGVSRLADLPVEWSRQHQVVGLQLNNHAFEPGLFAPKSPLPGNVIFRAEIRAETRVPKMGAGVAICRRMQGARDAAEGVYDGSRRCQCVL